jgi:hypothetical protein
VRSHHFIRHPSRCKSYSGHVQKEFIRRKRTFKSKRLKTNRLVELLTLWENIVTPSTILPDGATLMPPQVSLGVTPSVPERPSAEYFGFTSIDTLLTFSFLLGRFHHKSRCSFKVCGMWATRRYTARYTQLFTWRARSDLFIISASLHLRPSRGIR